MESQARTSRLLLAEIEPATQTQAPTAKIPALATAITEVLEARAEQTSQAKPPAQLAPAVVSADASVSEAKTATSKATVRVDKLAAQKVADPLGVASLQPIAGRLGGAAFAIFDNPETFSKAGVLGSTLAPVAGRGSTEFSFQGAARNFVLAQNNTGQAQRFSVVVRNNSSEPLTFKTSGTQYVKGTTKTDGSIPAGYLNDPVPAKGQPEFRGPQAIAAHSYLSAEPNKNGFIQKTIIVAPGKTAVLTDIYHEQGSEVFSLLDIKAATKDGKLGEFGVAAVSSPKSLKAADLSRISSGDYQAAGQEVRSANRRRGADKSKPETDFAPARAEKGEVGRPNGVIEKGSIFTGGRTIEVGGDGNRAEGDLILATRHKNAGSTAEIGQITSVLENPGKVGPASKLDDGNYGMTYKLNYMLTNSSAIPRQMQVLLTAPKIKGEATRNPDGGEITLPIKVNNEIVKARVDKRGEGRVLATVTVPAGGKINLPIEFTNFGNIFPPAGIEFRPVAVK